MRVADSNDELPLSCLERLLEITDWPEGPRAEAVRELKQRFPHCGEEIDRCLRVAAGQETYEQLLGSLAVRKAGNQRREQSPDRLGPYRILKRLGGGGMGTVLLAEDERLGRELALKLIRPERLFLPSARARFEREARVASRLAHPGICEVYEAGEVDGIPYLAMRRVQGRSLAEHIARVRAGHRDGSSCGPATPQELFGVVRLVERVARALHAAHEAGLVHRDVKPSNIVVEEDGNPVLVDFGLAQDEHEAEQSLTLSGELLGTPAYMSPEQVQPRGRRLDGRSDVFALGVVLYECLTLRRAFEAETRHEVCERILRSEPLPVRREMPFAGKDLEAVVARALEKAREKRYGSARELAEDLRRVRQFEPVRAKRAGWTSRLVKWTRRNPAAAAIAGILFVVTALTGILYADSQQSLWSFDRLAASLQLERARDAERALHPAWPERLPELRAWLTEHAAPLATELVEVRRALSELEEKSFLFEALSKLQVELAGFLETPLGELAGVRERIAWAEGVREASIQRQERQWAEARRSIRQDRRYGGLELRPQLGLVPLGKDPDSGLQEFAHLRSGKPAWRDPSTGRLRIENDTGLVFVLIPGGSFLMGAQKEDPDAANYDPLALPYECPPSRVSVEAFFLSKYELTQAQWERLAGTPANCHHPIGVLYGTRRITPKDPVDLVTWRECRRLMLEHGLRLPAEPEWEYACRAGTTTAWWTGQDRESLAGAANFFDRTTALWWNRLDDIAHWPDFDDGYVATAPVDTLRPNGFGLYHIAGNVSEWCDGLPEDAGPPAGSPTPEPGPVFRGSGVYGFEFRARSSFRSSAGKDTPHGAIGLRPARSVR